MKFKKIKIKIKISWYDILITNYEICNSQKLHLSLPNELKMNHIFISQVHMIKDIRYPHVYVDL